MDKTNKIKSLESKIVELEKDLAQKNKAIEEIKNEITTLKKNSKISKNTEQKKLSVSINIEPKINLKRVPFVKSDDGYVQVFTAGSSTFADKSILEIGIGVWFETDSPMNVSKKYSGKYAFGAANILACAEACEVAARCGVKKLEIQTESMLAIEWATNWIKVWKPLGWRQTNGQPIENKNELMLLEQNEALLADVRYVRIDTKNYQHGKALTLAKRAINIPSYPEYIQYTRTRN